MPKSKGIPHSNGKGLYHKPILLRLQNPTITLYCVIKENGVVLRQAEESDIVSVSITAELTTLFALLRGQDNAGKVTIQGQATVANALVSYVKKFNPSIEYVLADYTDDATAYAICSQVQRFTTRLGENLDNFYYSSERTLVMNVYSPPSQHELKKFYSDVDTLHNQVERFEARLTQWIHQAEPRETHD